MGRCVGIDPVAPARGTLTLISLLLQSHSFLAEFINYIKVRSHRAEPGCQLPASCVHVGCIFRTWRE